MNPIIEAKFHKFILTNRPPLRDPLKLNEEDLSEKAKNALHRFEGYLS